MRRKYFRKLFLFFITLLTWQGQHVTDHKMVGDSEVIRIESLDPEFDGLLIRNEHGSYFLQSDLNN